MIFNVATQEQIRKTNESINELNESINELNNETLHIVSFDSATGTLVTKSADYEEEA